MIIDELPPSTCHYYYAYVGNNPVRFVDPWGLAKVGGYSEETVPILLNVLENQRSIADSLITANTIKTITGIDVGYDLNFVKSYTSSDEPMRKEMILKWRSLSDKQSGFDRLLKKYVSIHQFSTTRRFM